MTAQALKKLPMDEDSSALNAFFSDVVREESADARDLQMGVNFMSARMAGYMVTGKDVVVPRADNDAVIHTAHTHNRAPSAYMGMQGPKGMN